MGNVREICPRSCRGDRAWHKRAPAKLTPWQTARPLRLASLFSTLMRHCACAAAHWKSNTGRKPSGKLFSLTSMPHQSLVAILFDSHGEFLTGEAIRFCARYSIALILPGGPGRLITTVETFAETRDGKGASKRDIDPAIMLAQCAAALDKRFAQRNKGSAAFRDGPHSGGGPAGRPRRRVFRPRQGRAAAGRRGGHRFGPISSSSTAPGAFRHSSLRGINRKDERRRSAGLADRRPRASPPIPAHRLDELLPWNWRPLAQAIPALAA